MLKKLLILLILYFIFSTQVYASILFEDNFDSLNNVNWTFNNQDGSIISENGILKLSSTGYNFPIIYSKDDSLFSNSSNIVFEAKFRFVGVRSMGDGISIGFTGSNGWPYYQFSLWADAYSGINLVYNNFNTYNYNYCSIGIPDDNRAGFISKRIYLSSLPWHYFRIEKNGTQYNLYIDKEFNPVPVVSTTQNQCIPKNIFLGNPMGGGNTSWTSLDIDYVKVGDGNWSENNYNKIIIIPGMGGSWNEGALVLNQVVPQSEWRMTPFANNYDSLITGLNSNGLIKNTDYFVYNYDWRKSLANQIIDFNSYVNSLNILSGEKIDIVGHSLGGVIGRIWTQENPVKVGKVITLASPHSGVLTAYEMWNGAKIANPTYSGSIALSVLLNLQKKNNQTAVETLRTYIPIIKDLLPTFNYLKKNGVVVLPPVNNYLISKNIDTSAIFNQLLAVSGTGFSTNQTINLGERNIFDTLSNRWEQGRPISYVLSDGDGTVLKNSSMFSGDGNANVVANHGNVPDKSVNLVLTELGLGKTITEIANASFNGAVFYMGSPALMKVNCGNGDVTETDGFVLIANKNIADCTVKLTGTANGIFHLVMGNSNDDESWKYAEGNISIGSTKNISINMVDFWYEQMLRETNVLLATYPSNNNLKNMIIAINAKNRTSLLNYYLLFRKSKLETIVTWRMINYLEKIINLEVLNPSLSTVTSTKNLALSAKNLAEKTGALLQRNKILPNKWQSLNYSQGEEMLLNPNYGKYLLAEKIFAMLWY